MIDIYSDLDLSFIPHPLTGDLTPKKGIDAIVRSVKRLAFWDAYDLPFSATFKSNVKKYLFEQNNEITRSYLLEDLKWILTKLEPRIVIRELDIDPTEDGRGFSVTLKYSIRSLNAEETITFTIERAR